MKPIGEGIREYEVVRLGVGGWERTADKTRRGLLSNDDTHKVVARPPIQGAVLFPPLHYRSISYVLVAVPALFNSSCPVPPTVSAERMAILRTFTPNRDPHGPASFLHMASRWRRSFSQSFQGSGRLSRHNPVRAEFNLADL